MDFNDSQQEAAFRKEARDFLEANAEKRSIISDKPNDKSPQIAVAGAPETVKGGKEAAQEALERAKVWQKKKAEAGFAAILCASLVNGPMLLLRSIRGFSSNRSMLWLATVPLALFGLGIFNLSAHAADLPELNAAFLANNLWLLIATILVIFMNAGFAMVEAGMCRSKNAVNILAKNLFVFALAVTS
jgi:hypothetical protein